MSPQAAQEPRTRLALPIAVPSGTHHRGWCGAAVETGFVVKGVRCLPSCGVEGNWAWCGSQ